MTGLTPDWDGEWTPTRAGRSRQQRGPIRAPRSNKERPVQGITPGVAPNRAARRFYQRTVTPRGQRIHLVLFGAWRRHDGRQQLKTRWSLARGGNAPGDGLTRRERREAWLETYRAARKNRRRRVTLDHDA